jgi:hypothetical protein
MPKPLHSAPHREPPPVVAEPLSHPEGGLGDEALEVLTTLLATGGSLRDGAVALEALGLPLPEQVAGLVRGHRSLAADPARDLDLAVILGNLVWRLDAPRELLPVLEANGWPAIRLIHGLLLRTDPDHKERGQFLAGALAGDMSLVRAFHEHGVETPFRHLEGCRFGGPILAEWAVRLRGRPDGTVWTPRDVTCHGLDLEDKKGEVARLDLSLDAIRVPSNKRDIALSFKDCAALERLPDVVELGPLGYLNLNGCVRFLRLPERLTVANGGCVDLTGCSAWDGDLPPGAVFGANATVILPDGRKEFVERLRAEAKGAVVTLPTTKADLARKARAIVQSTGGTFPAALSDLLRMGAIRETLVRLLVDHVERRTQAGGHAMDVDGYLGAMNQAFADAPDLVQEALSRVSWAPSSQNAWRFTSQGDPRQPWTHHPALAAAIQAFPCGLQGFGLEFEGLPKLETLPEGTVIRTGVTVNNCPAFRSLPNHLKCGGGLEVRGCPAWDRILPEGLEVGGKVVTDGHPKGATLAQWRAWYRFGPGK